MRSRSKSGAVSQVPSRKRPGHLIRLAEETPAGTSAGVFVCPARASGERAVREGSARPGGQLVPRQTSALATLIAFALLVFACGGEGQQYSGNSDPGPFPMTIVQSDGQALTLEKPATRIVSLSSHA